MKKNKSVSEEIGTKYNESMKTKTKLNKFACLIFDPQDFEDSSFYGFIMAKDENEAWEKLAKDIDLDEQVGDLQQAVEILQNADDVKYIITPWTEAEIRVIQ